MRAFLSAEGVAISFWRVKEKRLLPIACNYKKVASFAPCSDNSDEKFE
jgi:hypothetical protein